MNEIEKSIFKVIIIDEFLFSITFEARKPERRRVHAGYRHNYVGNCDETYKISSFNFEERPYS